MAAAAILASQHVNHAVIQVHIGVADAEAVAVVQAAIHATHLAATHVDLAIHAAMFAHQYASHAAQDIHHAAHLVAHAVINHVDHAAKHLAATHVDHLAAILALVTRI